MSSTGMWNLSNDLAIFSSNRDLPEFTGPVKMSKPGCNPSELESSANSLSRLSMVDLFPAPLANVRGKHGHDFIAIIENEKHFFCQHNFMHYLWSN